MTLVIDSNENRNHPDLTALLRQDIEDVDVQDINQSPNQSLVYPDFLISGGVKEVGINRKTVGEWLSNSDACIEQCQRELAGPVEHLVLLIEGVMVPSGLAMIGYNLDWQRAKAFSQSVTSIAHGTVPFAKRMYAVNPKHAQNEQTRLEFLGVQVVHTYSIQDTADKIIATHDLVLKNEPNRVLDKLYKPDIHVLGLTPQETRFARQLMSMDGIGEEAALTLAASFNNIMELVEYWQQGSSIADTMLRSGTRRIGTALERKLQAALGYTGIQTQQPAGKTDTAFIPVPNPQQTGYI